jgi:protein TonB
MPLFLTGQGARMLYLKQPTQVERTLNFIRLPVAFLLSVLVTVMLFYLMQFLIDSGEKALTEGKAGQIVDFTRVKEALAVETKRRRPKPPPLPDEAPKVIKPRLQADTNPEAWSNRFEAPVTDVAVNSSLNFRSDGEYLPILKVQPNYPQRALERGLVGWVVVEFTVDEIGRVIDPIVIDNCVLTWTPKLEQCADRPNKAFDKSALKAVTRFKYKPKVLDGQAIATVGVRNMITFELDE